GVRNAHVEASATDLPEPRCQAREAIAHESPDCHESESHPERHASDSENPRLSHVGAQSLADLGAWRLADHGEVGAGDLVIAAVLERTARKLAVIEVAVLG